MRRSGREKLFKMPDTAGLDRRVPVKKMAGYCLVMLLTLPFDPRFEIEDSSFTHRGDTRLDGLSTQIRDYRSWMRINPEPLRLPASLDFLCRAPTAADAVDTSRNPHRQKFFTVYVNDTGQHAMTHDSKPQFPPGSIIVKEKLLDKIGGKVELLTAMIKRQAGYNAASGNWEYLVLDANGANVEARGKLANCQSCHSAKKETDYVFRNYLPEKVRLKLR
jgi:hypothetical protein